MAERSKSAELEFHMKTGISVSGEDLLNQPRPVHSASAKTAAYNVEGSGAWAGIGLKALKLMCARYGIEWPYRSHARIPMEEKLALAQQCQARRKEKRFALLYDKGTATKQAARIIEKFGGPWGLVHALHALAIQSGNPADMQYRRGYNTVRKWILPRHKHGGHDGLIPSVLWPGVIRAARYQGIVLTAEDFVPELFEGQSGLETRDAGVKRTSSSLAKKPGVHARFGVRKGAQRNPFL